MEQIKEKHLKMVDNSNKSILARGCDPLRSLQFAQMAPGLLDNAEYIPTTNDVDFIEKLRSRKWSVVYFAPGACRYSASKQQIPGNNHDTKGWTLEQYKALVYKLQGQKVQIVESIYEQEAIELLSTALDQAAEVK